MYRTIRISPNILCYVGLMMNNFKLLAGERGEYMQARVSKIQTEGYSLFMVRLTPLSRLEGLIMSNTTSESLSATEREYKKALNLIVRATGTAQAARFDIAKGYTTMKVIHSAKKAIADIKASCGQVFEATWSRKITEASLDKFVSEYQDLVTNNGFYHGANTVTGQEFSLLPLTLEQSETVRGMLTKGTLRVSEVATRVKQAKISPEQATEAVKILLEKVAKIETATQAPILIQLTDKLEKAEKAEKAARAKVAAIKAEIAKANEARLLQDTKSESEPEPVQTEPAKPNSSKPRARVQINDASTFTGNATPLQASA